MAFFSSSHPSHHALLMVGYSKAAIFDPKITFKLVIISGNHICFSNIFHDYLNMSVAIIYCERLGLMTSPDFINPSPPEFCFPSIF